MKLPQCVFWFFLLPCVSSPETPPSVARFSNNDKIAGDIESLTPELLVWKSPVLEKPVSFFVKDLMDVVLPGSLPSMEADHEAILNLTNGDTISGQLASVTEDKVALDTAFAGRIQFKRANVPDSRSCSIRPLSIGGRLDLMAGNFLTKNPHGCRPCRVP